MTDEIYSITLTSFSSIIVCLSSPSHLDKSKYIYIYKLHKFASNLFSFSFFFSICYTLFIYLLKQSRIFLSLYWYKIFCSKKIYRRKLTFNLIYRYKIWIRDLFFPVDIFPTNEPYYAILLYCVYFRPHRSRNKRSTAMVPSHRREPK